MFTSFHKTDDSVLPCHKLLQHDGILGSTL